MFKHRDRKGRFSPVKKKALKYLIVTSVFFALLNIAVNHKAQAIVYRTKEVVKTIQVDNLSEKIETLKYEIVDRICEYESRGWERLGFDSVDALIVFDPDNTGKAVHMPSFGYCQLKTATVQGYVKKFLGQELTQLEANLLAQTKEEARKLAHDIIFNEIGGVWNWENTVYALNTEKEGNYDVVEKITMIRELMD